MRFSHSVESDSCEPARLFCPRDFSGKNTEVGCHFLFQGIFLTQGLNSCLLHWQADSVLRANPVLSSQHSHDHLHISNEKAFPEGHPVWNCPYIHDCYHQISIYPMSIMFGTLNSDAYMMKEMKETWKEPMERTYGRVVV